MLRHHDGTRRRRSHKSWSQCFNSDSINFSLANRVRINCVHVNSLVAKWHEKWHADGDGGDGGRSKCPIYDTIFWYPFLIHIYAKHAALMADRSMEFMLRQCWHRALRSDVRSSYGWCGLFWLQSCNKNIWIRIFVYNSTTSTTTSSCVALAGREYTMYPLLHTTVPNTLGTQTHLHLSCLFFLSLSVFHFIYIHFTIYNLIRDVLFGHMNAR